MSKKRLIKLLVVRTIGNFLILFSITGLLATFGPAVYYEASYRFEKLRGVEYTLAPDVDNSNNETELGKLVRKYNDENGDQGQAPSLLSDVLENNRERVLVPPSAEFSIVIPKIGASETVKANVDPSNKEEYLTALVDSIAHAKGTAYPGLGGTTYLFAHSADSFWNIGRYNAVFYLLKDLVPGDEVFVFFQGKKYTYVVYDQKTVEANDVGYIDAALGQGEKLILQTCWPPGTDWKRTLVFARLKGGS